MKFYRYDFRNYRFPYKQQVEYIRKQNYIQDRDKLELIQDEIWKRDKLIEQFKSVTKEDLNTSYFKLFLKIFINYLGIETLKELNNTEIKDDIESLATELILLKD